MSSPNEATVTIDYVKYIIPLDHDRLQSLAANLNAHEERCGPHFKWGRTARLSVLDSTAATGGRRRLCLDAWGEGAKELIELMNPTYLEHVTRLDYRRTLPGVETRDLEAFVMRQSMNKKSRRNVQTFRSNPRQKNDKRDIGGHGVYFGSRKSDSHSAAYQRGKEIPAIEHRFQGRKAADIAMEALALWYEGEGRVWLSEPVLKVLERYARQELVAATGYTSWERLAEAMRVDREHMDKLNAASDWLETPEERKAWEEMSEIEQLQMQQRRFVPLRPLGIKPTGPVAERAEQVQTEAYQLLERLKASG
jgi:hypothetical protein